MRLCDKDFICVYKVSLSFDTTQVKNRDSADAKGAAAMTYTIKIKPASALNTFEIEGESYVAYDRFNGHPSAGEMGPIWRNATSDACNLEDFQATLADDDGFNAVR